MTDVFGTADLREAVLNAWNASPTRFREDANTEEDHARGYYRDRVITELAQNAADAASQSGQPGHLALTLGQDGSGHVLEAWNTGVPLTREGARALATMRASAKHVPAQPAGTGQPAGTSEPAGTGQPETVGRFGVGFAAVRAVSDEIVIASRVDNFTSQPEAGSYPASAASTSLRGVEFSLDKAQTLLAQEADSGLEPEIAVRRADLPILRLPFPISLTLPEESVPAPPAVPTAPTVPTARAGAPQFTTLVRLRLRDAQAAAAVRAQLEDLDELLLLTLPGLDSVTITLDQEPARELRLTTGDWRSVHASGQLAPELLADRPIEERARTQWSLTWAVRTAVFASAPQGTEGVTSIFGRSESAGAPGRRGVIHAPTATDEPCTLPATLIATLPLDPSRRHVAPGPLTEEILRYAAAAYVDLVAQVAAAGGAALRLVPTGLPAGSIDAALHEAIRAALPDVPLIPALVGQGAGDAENNALDGIDGSACDEGEDSYESSGSAGAEPVGSYLLRPRDANLLDGPLAHERDVVVELARTVHDLTWLPSDQVAAARLLGVQIRPLSDAIDALPSADRRLLDALSTHLGVPGVREGLVDLPVMLLDGRVVRGPRGVVVPGVLNESEPARDDAQDAQDPREGPSHSGVADRSRHPLAAFATWGLRVADPAHAHPLLLRLGAIPGDPLTILGTPALAEAIADLTEAGRRAYDVGELEETDAAALEAILVILATAAEQLTPLPDDLRARLGALPLHADDGEMLPAHDLVLPGTPAADLFDALGGVDPDVLLRWGAPTLELLGVRADVEIISMADVVTDASGEDPDLGAPDRIGDYLAYLAEHLGDGAYVGELVCIADLDAVAADRWPDFLARIANNPATRAALLDPVGGQISYAAWWLREHFDAPFARPGSDVPYLARTPKELTPKTHTPNPPLRSGYLLTNQANRQQISTFQRGVPVGGWDGIDSAVWDALGAVGSLDQLRAHEWDLVFEEMPDLGFREDLEVALGLWAALGAVARTEPDFFPGAPDRILARVGDEAQVCDAHEVVVALEPMWAQLTGPGETAGRVAGIVPAPDARTAALVAEFLDVPVISSATTQVEVGDHGATRIEFSVHTADLLMPLIRPGPGGSPFPSSWMRHTAPFQVTDLDSHHADGGSGAGFVRTGTVRWWVAGTVGSAEPDLHAVDLEALACALAQWAGRWPQRYVFADLLTHPDEAQRIVADTAWDRCD